MRCPDRMHIPAAGVELSLQCTLEADHPGEHRFIAPKHAGEPERALPMFTVYRSPLDYPGKWVVRRFLCVADGPVPDPKPLVVATSLAEARAVLPPYLTCVGRQPDDEPQVHETWL